MNHLREKVSKEVSPGLDESIGHYQCHADPSIEKVVVNIGLGEAMDNPKALGCCCDRSDSHYRTKTSNYQGAQEHCQFQIT